MNAAAAALVVLNGRQAFGPRASLFAHNEQGFWYDPSDLSSMYQDSAGTTPVTAVEQAVGLILDKIRGLVLGPELVTNGDFSSGSTGWTFYAGSTITPAVGSVTSGVCTITSADAGNTARARQTISTFVVGRTYRISATVSTSTGLPALMVANGDELSNIFAQESYSNSARDAVLYWTATATSAKVGFRCAGAGNAVFDNISVRELAGNHAIQPTSASRPTLRARYNLLTYSEQFDNAGGWAADAGITLTSNFEPAPAGSSAAYQVNFGAGNRQLWSNAPATAPTGSITASIYIKGTNGETIKFGLTGDEGIYTLTGVWQLLTRTSTTYTAARLTLNTYSSVTARVVSIAAADLRRSNDTYLPYQRIAAATDYDTVGFPPYLAFDGVDDSLYTGGSIDFSATDKMTVWAGVTKLSDVGAATIVGYNANYTSAPGFEVMSPGFNGSPEYFIGASSTVAGAFYGLKTGFASPLTSTLAASFDITNPTNTDRLKLRVDAAEQALTTAGAGLQPGTFGAAVLYIGRRGNTNLPLNGRLYSLIGRGAATSAALIQQAERWVAGKQGRTL